MTGAEPLQPAYAPLTVAEVYAVLERHKKRLVCAPDVYERVQTAVRDAGLDGLYRVVENRWLDDGRVLMMASEAELFDVPFPQMPRTIRAVAAVWAEDPPASE